MEVNQEILTSEVHDKLRYYVGDVKDVSISEDNIFMYAFNENNVMFIAKQAPGLFNKIEKEGRQAISSLQLKSNSQFEVEILDYDNVAFVSLDPQNIFNMAKCALIVPGACLDKLTVEEVQGLLGNDIAYMDKECIEEESPVIQSELTVPTNAVGQNRRTPVLWTVPMTAVAELNVPVNQFLLDALRESYPPVEDSTDPARFAFLNILDDGNFLAAIVYNRNNKGYQGTIPEAAIVKPVSVLAFATEAKTYIPEAKVSDEVTPTVGDSNVEVPELSGKKSAASALLGK